MLVASLLKVVRDQQHPEATSPPTATTRPQPSGRTPLKIEEPPNRTAHGHEGHIKVAQLLLRLWTVGCRRPEGRRLEPAPDALGVGVAVGHNGRPGHTVVCPGAKPVRVTVAS